MKRFLLSLIVLTYSLSVHASEQQSWYKSPTFIASATAALSAATAAGAWWAWKRYTENEAGLAKAKADQTTLPDELKQIGEVLLDNDVMKAHHMQKRNVLNDGTLTRLSAQKIRDFDLAPHVKAHQKARTGHDFASTCPPCYKELGTSDYVSRKEPCSLFSAAYNALDTAAKAHKTKVEEELSSANHIVTQREKVDYTSLKWRAKAIQYTCSAVSLASLGYLGLSKLRTSK